MPGESGFDLQQSLAEFDDCMPIIFLTGHGDIPASVRAMKAGAIDFLTKPVPRETLLRTIQTALERDAAERKSRAILRDLRARYESLTAREREVLTHVVGGKLNKQIAFAPGTRDRPITANPTSIIGKP